MIKDTDLAELMSTWQYGYCLLEVEDRYGVDIVTTFDHDFEFHLLVREWDMENLGHNPVYSLWFIGSDNTCLVKRWIFEDKDAFAPIVEAAEIVSEWRKFCSEYSDMRYGNGI